MGTSTQTEVLTKPILHIEARLKTFKDDVIIRTDQVAPKQPEAPRGEPTKGENMRIEC